MSIDGVLKSVVKQKTPIARVFDGEDSFYIDYKGNTMPLSANFTARVPLVSGKIDKKKQRRSSRIIANNLWGRFFEKKHHWYSNNAERELTNA